MHKTQNAILLIKHYTKVFGNKKVNVFVTFNKVGIVT